MSLFVFILMILLDAAAAARRLGEGRQAQLGGGAARGDLIHFGKLGAGAGEADFQALGFPAPAVGFGLPDAFDEVVRIFTSRGLAVGSGRSSGQRM